MAPPCLYNLCLDFLVPILEKYSRNMDKQIAVSNPLDKLAAVLAEDLLVRAFEIANKDASATVWKKEWKIFFTRKIRFAVFSWNRDLVKFISKCQSLNRLEIVHWSELSPELFLELPKSIITVDFDGELVYRGKATRPLQFKDSLDKSWLPDSEDILKALHVLRKKPTEIQPTSGILSLSELHLGTVTTTSADLKIILKNCPCLRLLRHYQLVSALYEMHCEEWKKKQVLPTYKLKNLDVDFSHVVRCRMSPEWVLSPEALQLAVILCPNTLSIRVRFDCSTPHDVLTPLMGLSKLREFSAVCVSSGERTNLDFSDMAPIFEKFGPSGLAFLELKVIEEIEIHVILEHCQKLEVLVLSGCGYVTPPTCPSYNCSLYKPGSMRKMKLLFFADGDDFSWDHGVPECFWKATLLPAGRSHTVHLEGLFLEYPRIPPSLGSEIFRPSNCRLPFPGLKVLSLCRYQELTVEDVVAICGADCGGNDKLDSIKYIRLSECERIDEQEGKRLTNWLKQANVDVFVNVDTTSVYGSNSRPYTYKISRPRF